MLPFSVFLRSDRPCYYVSFKNEETGSYLPAISTKKTKQADAVRQAWVWYRDGVPHKGETLDLKSRLLRDTILHATISMPDAEYIIAELKRRNLIVSCIFAGAPDAVNLADFLEEFWDYEASPYIREKLRREHSIHRNYVKLNYGIVKQYWRPFFQSKLLGDFLPHDLECFIDHLSGIKHGDDKKPLFVNFLSGKSPLPPQPAILFPACPKHDTIFPR